MIELKKSTHIKLNASQKRAVNNLDGALLILAGAGTGKTRVLTHRVVKILSSTTVPAHCILCVTFTNKAAREMYDRIAMLVPDKVKGLWLGTFHALALRILQQHPHICGLKKNFFIIDNDDQYRIIRQILQEKNIDPKRVRPGIILSPIQSWKNRGLEPERVPNNEFSDLCGLPQEVYSDYQRRLIFLNACDFGDLLLYNIKIFAYVPEVLQYYQKRFRYILVDEYQDTNYVQNLWLSLLAHHHRQLCCVGDDDQSIYGWRGAEIRNILEFQHRFPEATIIRLEENYRSTQAILSAAVGIIDHNTDRLGKNLVATKGEGWSVGLAGFYDSRAEAIAITDEINKRYLQGVPYSQMAILIRVGHVGQMLETTLAQAGISYCIYGGLRFYEREEIRDVIAYLRLIIRPEDDLAFSRVINKPSRGIGQTTQHLIRTEAQLKHRNYMEVMLELQKKGSFNIRTQRAVDKFITLYHYWQSQASMVRPEDLVYKICCQAGIYDYWRASGKFEAETKLENLGELQSAISEFQSLTDFLEYVTLVTDDEREQSDDRVTIMTIHAAKGLEFGHVFLPAWEEGIFPNARALNEENKGLFEERRLAYVAITRAQQRLNISFARLRLMHGQWYESYPSRFLQEIPEHCLDNTVKDINQTMINKITSSYKKNKIKNTYIKQINKGYTISSSTNIKNSKIKDISGIGKPGQRCCHDKFGEGTITSLDSEFYVIEFDYYGQKKISFDFINLLLNKV